MLLVILAGGTFCLWLWLACIELSEGNGSDLAPPLITLLLEGESPMPDTPIDAAELQALQDITNKRAVARVAKDKATADALSAQQSAAQADQAKGDFNASLGAFTALIARDMVIDAPPAPPAP